MQLAFFDPRIGGLRDFRPADPPSVGVEAAPGGSREDAVRAALTDALVFLGLAPRPGAEIRVGGAEPGPDVVWLKVGPLTGEAAPDAATLAARGFSLDDFRYFCLKTRYRDPLAFSWQALASARQELGSLRASARALAGVSLEPSSRGRAGYLHRFRESLARDLDLPGALACVWDALRPGALSPGSKAALVKEFFPVLGLE